jgi:HSP20 family protein
MTQMQHTDEKQTYWATPPVDVLENDQELLLLADLPGVKKEDVKLSFEDGQLKLEAQAGDRTYKRTFEAKVELDADKITAEMKHGVLSLHLPKAEKKVRQIAIG